MEDWLRISVAYWHSFAANGSDMFGAGTFDRPWTDGRRTRWMRRARRWRRRSSSSRSSASRSTASTTSTSRPTGASFREFRSNLDALADDALGYQERTGIRLLWGTANLFTHPRFQAGAATNPDPEVFAYAAAQVKNMLEVTKRLGGANYVLWGGREGYDSLLNTDLRREGEQLARFLHLVVDEKHRIGFDGTLLIEPKPMEPTKHQYDYDAAVVHGFLARHGLEGEYKLNIEANHATLAGHSFHHEIAYATANDLLGSVDANRGDPQNGWDTDQFPNSVEDLVLPMYEIVLAGGLGNGGFNFDAKLRRQSIDRADLFHAHIGGIDTLARALIVAAKLADDGDLARMKDERYSGWNGELGRAITDGAATLAELADRVEEGGSTHPVSGKQGRERRQRRPLGLTMSFGRACGRRWGRPHDARCGAWSGCGDLPDGPWGEDLFGRGHAPAVPEPEADEDCHQPGEDERGDRGPEGDDPEDREAVGLEQEPAERGAAEHCLHLGSECCVGRLRHRCGADLRVDAGVRHLTQVDRDEVVRVGLCLWSGEKLLTGVLLQVRDHPRCDLGARLRLRERGRRREEDLLLGELVVHIGGHDAVAPECERSRHHQDGDDDYPSCADKDIEHFAAHGSTLLRSLTEYDLNLKPAPKAGVRLTTPCRRGKIRIRGSSHPSEANRFHESGYRSRLRTSPRSGLRVQSEVRASGETGTPETPPQPDRG